MKQPAVDIVDRIWDGLTTNALNTVGALVIFLLALPLIRAGLRDKPPAPPPSSPPTPIQIESPWFVQTVIQVQQDIEKIKDQHGVLSNQVAGIAKLLRQRQKRADRQK